MFKNPYGKEGEFLSDLKYPNNEANRSNFEIIAIKAENEEFKIKIESSITKDEIFPISVSTNCKHEFSKTFYIPIDVRNAALFQNHDIEQKLDLFKDIQSVQSAIYDPFKDAQYMCSLDKTPQLNEHYGFNLYDQKSCNALVEKCRAIVEHCSVIIKQKALKLDKIQQNISKATSINIKASDDYDSDLLVIKKVVVLKPKPKPTKGRSLSKRLKFRNRHFNESYVHSITKNRLVPSHNIKQVLCTKNKTVEDKILNYKKLYNLKECYIDMTRNNKILETDVDNLHNNEISIIRKTEHFKDMIMPTKPIVILNETSHIDSSMDLNNFQVVFPLSNKNSISKLKNPVIRSLASKQKIFFVTCKVFLEYMGKYVA